MKITGITTHLVDASLPGGWAARNWCFVTVETDEAICRAHPSQGNITPPSPSTVDAMYVQSRSRRRRLFQVT